MIELEAVDIPKLVEPGERANIALAGNGADRIFRLSRLVAQEKGSCVWCGSVLTGRKLRWCSRSCIDSAFEYANPQSDASKIRRLIKQNFACAECGLSFAEFIRQKIVRLFQSLNRIGSLYVDENGKLASRSIDDPLRKVSLAALGTNTGEYFQTDHIKPVYLGGAGIDPRNLQVLCTACHKEKTAREAPAKPRRPRK